MLRGHTTLGPVLTRIIDGAFASVACGLPPERQWKEPRRTLPGPSPASGRFRTPTERSRPERLRALRKLFTQNAPHLRCGKRFIRLGHVSGKRVIDQSLVSLAGALRKIPEVPNDRVVQIDCYARLAAIGGQRATAPSRKVNVSLRSRYALSVRAYERRSVARCHHA
jgi:hypothetical protein